MTSNPYHNAVFTVPLESERYPQFSGKVEKIVMDSVSPTMAEQIKNAHQLYFPHTVDRKNLLRMSQGAISFSHHIGDELPFRGYPSYAAYKKADSIFDNKRYCEYLEKCATTRTLSAATSGQDMDCVVHALAIAHHIGHEGWKLVHMYQNSNTKHRSRHLLLAQPIEDLVVLIDSARCASCTNLGVNYFLRTKEDFAENFFEPAIEYPLQKTG